MSHLTLVKVLGSNTPWYSSSPQCLYNHAENAELSPDLIQQGCPSHEHMIIGQNVEQQFGDRPSNRYTGYKKTDEVFHRGVYVSQDKPSRHSERARILFIHPSLGFQLNCQLSSRLTEESSTRMNGALGDDNAIDRTCLLPTLLLRIVEKIAHAYEAAQNKSDFLERLTANTPLRFEFEVRDLYVPENGQTPCISTFKNTLQPRHTLRHISPHFKNTSQPVHPVIEQEADDLLAPLLATPSEEKKELESVVVDQKDAAVHVDDQDLSCLDHIGIFFTALLETLMDCLGACWGKVCG